MADADYKRWQQAFLEQKQNLNSLNQQLAARQNQLTETRYSLKQLPTVMAGKIQVVRSELATTEQRITVGQTKRTDLIETHHRRLSCRKPNRLA
jgi:membrane fusion protein